ncbi:MAG: ABC transporter ATP-binding protein [Actinomycetota bacterium]
MSAVLETSVLACRFGGLQALSEVSIVVEEGRVLGIIGPNGAGKSTLINVVTGYVKPDSGQVLIGGKDLTGRKPWDLARSGVARTFQIVKPFRDMTVRENAAVGAMFGPGDKTSVQDSLGRSNEILERVGLSDKADAHPGELSVADTKRLELAKALAMKPRLLLLDEVMAGLRPKEVDATVELIRSLRSEGITVIAIEHVMRAIMAISDEIFVLHEGRELAHGPPQEVARDERVIEAYLGERYARQHEHDDVKREGPGA